MNDKIKQLLDETKKNLEELDEQELQARIDLNAAFKKYDQVRTAREMQIQKLRLVTDQI
jgi:hypothetical protein